jgi:hypothetical protein
MLLCVASTLILTLLYLLSFLSKVTSSYRSIYEIDKVVIKIKIIVNSSRLQKHESKIKIIVPQNLDQDQDT